MTRRNAPDPIDAADARTVLAELARRAYSTQVAGDVAAAAVRLDNAQAEQTGATVLPHRWATQAERHQAELDALAAADAGDDDDDADGIAAGENPGSDA